MIGLGALFIISLLIRLNIQQLQNILPNKILGQESHNTSFAVVIHRIFRNANNLNSKKELENLSKSDPSQAARKIDVG